MVDPQTAAGHTATYAIELDGSESFTVRFIDGHVDVADGGWDRVDCTLSAEPIAYLLVISRRLSKAAAFALGLLRAGGPRPELAFSYHDLFTY